MKKFGRKLLGAFFDVRTIVAVSGIILSIIAHELFHLIIHWGEIDSIHILPGNDAIVEILFTPTTTYNLFLEEAIAYTITMITLLLTALLVSDINEVKSETSALDVLFGEKLHEHYHGDQQIASTDLARVLGIETVY